MARAHFPRLSRPRKRLDSLKPCDPPQCLECDPVSCRWKVGHYAVVKMKNWAAFHAISGTPKRVAQSWSVDGRRRVYSRTRHTCRSIPGGTISAFVQLLPGINHSCTIGTRLSLCRSYFWDRRLLRQLSSLATIETGNSALNTTA